MKERIEEMHINYDVMNYDVMLNFVKSKSNPIDRSL